MAKTTLDILRNHPAVEDVSDERAQGNGVIVTLRPGHTVDPLGGCHVFGEDTPSAALQHVRRIEKLVCACGKCKAAIVGTAA